jgi:phosphoglycolate phosphatase
LLAGGGAFQRGLFVKLLLFDVDGTLVLTGGAGMRGMTRAFELTFGVPNALQGIPVAGRTDPAILDDAMSRAGLSASEADRRRFFEIYLPILAEEMERPVPTAEYSQQPRFKGPLPGVPELVRALRVRDDVFLALLTGNQSRAAQVKLGYFGLWEPFVCGAFGEDAALRHELVPVAVDRALAAGCPPVAPGEVIVIGDTPLDVDCAQRAGVRSLAVATGGHTVESLRATNPDHVVPTLEDTEAVVRWLTARG